MSIIIIPVLFVDGINRHFTFVWMVVNGIVNCDRTAGLSFAK